jgi:hypothetical protein
MVEREARKSEGGSTSYIYMQAKQIKTHGNPPPPKSTSHPYRLDRHSHGVENRGMAHIRSAWITGLLFNHPCSAPDEQATEPMTTCCIITISAAALEYFCKLFFLIPYASFK